MARNGISRRTIGRAAGLAMLWVVVGLIGSSAASAAHSYLWSDPIKTANRGVYGAGGREAVYAANKRHGGLPDTERVFNPDGVVEWEAETEPTTIMPPALASDGSGYVVWVNGGVDVIEAINRAGIVRWNYSVPNGGAVTGLVAGDDGAAYAAVGTSAGEEVLRLSPEGGSVTFAKTLPEADGGVLKLFAESSGVAVATATHVLFVSQQGEITADVDVPIPSGNATSWWAPGSDTITGNNTGDIFIASGVGNGDYQIETQNGIAVTKVEPTGRVAWTADTPANGGAGAATTLAALPDGGAAYDVSSQSIGVLNPDGSSRWNSENPEGYAGRMLTDGSDHLDLASLVNGAICSDNVKNCGGFRIDQLQAANGQLANLVSVVSTKDGDDDWFCGGLALGSQLFYVLDDTTAPGPSSCTPAGKPLLQAYALPETPGSYPTPPATTEPAGTTPPSSYVALGDSYSSGEGNPPYELGTDDEGIPDLCHRSMIAYGRLLDQALNLGVMSFKACSGAVTNDIFAPSANNPSEPAQVSWLTANTKIVTLTIGGNDAGFAWLLEHCVAVPPVANNFGCSSNAGLEAETQARLSALAGGSYATTPPPQSESIHSVLSVIQAIHDHAQSARIVIGLYPMLFGTSKKHYAFTLAPGFAACEVGSAFGDALWVGYEDAQWLNERGEQLNQIIMDAVAEAAHEGIAVSYARPAKFANHGFCDKQEVWFHPLELTITKLSELEPTVAGKASSFHPIEAGQRLGYETAFARKLK